MRAARTRVALIAALLLAPIVAGAGLLGGQRSLSASPPAQQISELTDLGESPDADTFDFPAVSGDGRFVTYAASFFLNESLSRAGFLRDRTTDRSVLIPSSTFDAGIPALSRDGCHIAFWQRDGDFWHVYVWNWCLDPVGRQIQQAVGIERDFAPAHDDRDLAISADGRFVAAANGDPKQPVVRADMTAGTSAAMPTNQGALALSVDISDDGRVVAAAETPTGFDTPVPAHVVAWDVASNQVEPISVSFDGALSLPGDSPSVSADGRFVAFTSDSARIIEGLAPESTQLYVRDRAAGTTALVTSTAGQAMPGNLTHPDITPDGTQIALSQSQQNCDCEDPAQTVVARSTTGFTTPTTFELVSFGVNSQPISDSAVHPGISATGRVVAFASYADEELGVPPPPPPTTNPLFVFDQREDVWARERPPALSITPLVDFGLLDVGATSAAQTATVTNTSNVIVPIGTVSAVVPPFSVVTDGCTGAVLQPGATCSIALQYQPVNPVSSQMALSVSGEGVTATAQVRGTARRPVPPTTATTTTPRTTTTTTTAPRPGALTIAPAALDFGSAVVGTVLPGKTLTVTNTGGSSVKITGGVIAGAGAGQFTILTNGCTGKTLAAGGSCTVTIGATPTTGGSTTATFTVTAGGLSATAALQVAGTFAPTLLVKPGVLRGGEVGKVTGTGFPPNAAIQLAFQGESPLPTVTSDGAGAFSFDIVIFRNGRRIGGQVLTAVDQPGLFTGVFTTFLIELSTFSPSGSVSPAITNGVRALVSRNG